VAAAAAKNWVKEDGMEVLKASAGLGGIFASLRSRLWQAEEGGRASEEG